MNTSEYYHCACCGKTLKSFVTNFSDKYKYCTDKCALKGPMENIQDKIAEVFNNKNAINEDALDDYAHEQALKNNQDAPIFNELFGGSHGEKDSEKESN